MRRVVSLGLLLLAGCGQRDSAVNITPVETLREPTAEEIATSANEKVSQANAQLEEKVKQSTDELSRLKAEKALITAQMVQLFLKGYGTKFTSPCAKVDNTNASYRLVFVIQDNKVVKTQYDYTTAPNCTGEADPKEGHTYEYNLEQVTYNGDGVFNVLCEWAPYTLRPINERAMMYRLGETSLLLER